MRKRRLNIQFPTGGLNKRYAFQSQPPYTTPDCVNVRPFDVDGNRQRGGSRPGFDIEYSTTFGLTQTATSAIVAPTASSGRMIAALSPLDVKGGSTQYDYGIALAPDNTLGELDFSAKTGTADVTAFAAGEEPDSSDHRAICATTSTTYPFLMIGTRTVISTPRIYEWTWNYAGTIFAQGNSLAVGSLAYAPVLYYDTVVSQYRTVGGQISTTPNVYMGQMQRGAAIGSAATWVAVSGTQKYFIRHCAVWHNGLRKLFVFGGQYSTSSTIGTATVNTAVWSHDGYAWSSHTPTTNPGQLYDATCWVDESTGKIYLFGGIDSSGAYVDTLWEYTPGGEFVSLGSAVASARSSAVSLFNGNSTSYTAWVLGGETAASGGDLRTGMTVVRAIDESSMPVRMLANVEWVDSSPERKWRDDFTSESLDAVWSVQSYGSSARYAPTLDGSYASATSTTPVYMARTGTDFDDLDTFRASMFIALDDNEQLDGDWEFNIQSTTGTTVAYVRLAFTAATSDTYTATSVVGASTTTATGSLGGFLPGWFTVEWTSKAGSDTLTAYYRGDTLISLTGQTFAATTTRFAVGVRANTAGSPQRIDSVVLVASKSTVTDESTSKSTLCMSSGGTLYYETLPGTLTAVASVELSDDHRFRAVSSKQKLYIADGEIMYTGTAGSTSSAPGFVFDDAVFDGTPNWSDVVAAGDVLEVTAGTGATLGSYLITNVHDNDGLTLNGTPGAGLTNLSYHVHQGMKVFDPSAGTASSWASLSQADQLAKAVIFSGTDGTTNSSPGTTFDSASIVGNWKLSVSVGDFVHISAGSGATTGYYRITAVGTGNCTLESSPGASLSGLTYRILSGVTMLTTVPNNCALIALYRGRIVLSGSQSDPQIWYMSRQLDPLDWDYSKEDAQAAVASTSARAGEIGQPITALATFGDDAIVFAGRSSLYVLRGDPAYGGVMNCASDVVGIIGGDAYCTTPEGWLVFLSDDGVYIMTSPQSQPQPFSKEVMPKDLKNVDPNMNQISMGYDARYGGIHLFISPTNSASKKSHWWIDMATKSFWPVSLPSGSDPFCCLSAYNEFCNGHVVLCGCRDGSIKRFRREFRSDGLNVIESSAAIGPISLGHQNGRDGILDTLDATLGDGSDDVTWSVCVGETPEAVADVDATAQETGTWSEGRNYTDVVQARGAAASIVVGGTGIWSMENIVATVSDGGDYKKL